MHPQLLLYHTRSTTAGSVSRPRSTASSSRRPFGEISAEAASASSKAPLVGVLADRSHLRRLSAHGVQHHAQQGDRSRTTLSNLGFEHERGQLREWMTVARDRPTWGTIVESRLGLPPPGSFTNLRRQLRTTNDY
jgi:hypothetical protein